MGKKKKEKREEGICLLKVEKRKRKGGKGRKGNFCLKERREQKS
jgi:hypothetical protein